jgi:hypothetical protein
MWREKFHRKIFLWAENSVLAQKRSGERFWVKNCDSPINEMSFNSPFWQFFRLRVQKMRLACDLGRFLANGLILDQENTRQGLFRFCSTFIHTQEQEVSLKLETRCLPTKSQTWWAFGGHDYISVNNLACNHTLLYTGTTGK